jgi:hypothetical protein
MCFSERRRHPWSEGTRSEGQGESENHRQAQEMETIAGSIVACYGTGLTSPRATDEPRQDGWFRAHILFEFPIRRQDAISAS